MPAAERGSRLTAPEIGYEAARAELSDVVRRLESGGQTLEESLALWQRGEELAEICERWLSGATARLNAVIAANERVPVRAAGRVSCSQSLTSDLNPPSILRGWLGTRHPPGRSTGAASGGVVAGPTPGGSTVTQPPDSPPASFPRNWPSLARPRIATWPWSWCG